MFYDIYIEELIKISKAFKINGIIYEESEQKEIPDCEGNKFLFKEVSTNEVVFETQDIKEFKMYATGYTIGRLLYLNRVKHLGIPVGIIPEVAEKLFLF
jgi:hypothetical protein